MTSMEKTRQSMMIKRRKHMSITKVIKSIEEANKQRKELISNTDYMEWLYNFTRVYPNFVDTQWDYEVPEEMSSDDCEKVKLLTHFFTAIEEYSTLNLIASNGTERDFSYVMKYKDKYFEIGVCIGQGAFNYVVTSEKAETEYILFENIMNNSKDANLDVKLDKLEKIKLLTEELKALSTPEDAIVKTIKNTYNV